MYISFPIMYRGIEMETTCSQCGHKQTMPITIHPAEYESYPQYLDGFRSGMEENFFNMKFVICEECGHFDIESLSRPAYERAKEEDIRDILKSNKEKEEKAFLIHHIINNTEDTLKELYWYYDFKKPESDELKKYRDELIIYYTNYLQDKSNEDTIFAKRMLVELNRRKGDFATAIKHIKSFSKKTSPINKEYFFTQTKLCNKRDSGRR